MFDFLENVAKATVKVALTPVAVVADAVTLGGLMTDEDEPYTVSTVKGALNNLKQAVTEE